MLKISDLCVKYDNIRVLHGLSLNVKQGELVALIGANGAGKSTLLKAISGLIKAESGNITFKDLPKLIEEGKFREDLYYRLNVIPIHIPPLRRRKDDIFSLTYFFLSKNAEKYNTNKRLSMELLSILINYDWPGNIRELENLIERFFATSNSGVLTEADLPAEFNSKMAREKVKGPDLAPSTLKEQLEEVEKRIILEKYKQCKSSYKVAKELDISQSQAYQKIKKYLADNYNLT